MRIASVLNGVWRVCTSEAREGQVWGQSPRVAERLERQNTRALQLGPVRRIDSTWVRRPTAGLNVLLARFAFTYHIDADNILVHLNS